MKHFFSAITVVVAAYAICSPHFAHAGDLFVGSYESETRENFGTDTYGEYKIDISALGPGKYLATVTRGSRTMGKAEVSSCAVADEAYLGNRPAGRAEVLCSQPGLAFMSYAENGIVVPAVDMMQVAKGESTRVGPPPMKAVHRKAKYYARVGWGIYGFRKIEK